MSFVDLLFLAAGGAIGSGALLSGAQAQDNAGWWSLGSWAIGGAAMLVVAAVMVTLSTRAPTTGGLVFLPWQGSGPLLAIVVAAGLWICCTANPVSEAIAVVRDLGTYWNWPGLVANSADLTGPGVGWAFLFLLPMIVVNMLGPRRFLLVNNCLTVFKILVPLMIIGLLVYAQLAHVGPTPAPAPRHPPAHGPIDMLTTVVNSGTLGSAVIFSYIGFQGPLDFAGNVKQRGIGEAARLRWAVYGTILGSFLLYFGLQFVAGYISGHSFSQHVPPACAVPHHEQPTYASFTCAVAPGWARGPAVWLVRLDTVLSPIGTGMVFTYVLTREVAALSSAHLTHRGLQVRKNSLISVKGRVARRLLGDTRLEIYWLILLVDLGISMALLLISRGRLSLFTVLTAMLALVAYAAPAVVLAALRQRDPGAAPGFRRSAFPATAFVVISVILFLADWDQLWKAMAALAVGCLLLYCLPVFLPRVTLAARWYDAKAHAARFRDWRTDPAAQSALLLLGFLAVLVLASLVNAQIGPGGGRLIGALPVAVAACFVFGRLVTLSGRYMAEHPPTLPTPPPPGGATEPR